MQAVKDFISQVEGELGSRDRPLVSLTYAQSLDGSIARRRGEQLLLSGPASMKITHQLRAWHDGILVGIGTVLSDNPRLTVRHVDGENPQAIILDSKARLPKDANTINKPNKPWLFVSTAAKSLHQTDLKKLGCTIYQCTQTKDGFLDLGEILHTLYARGIKRLMVEGGASVIQSFLSEGLADLAILTVAPIFVGGLKAVENLIAKPEKDPLFPKLSPVFSQQVGENVMVWGQFLKDD